MTTTYKRLLLLAALPALLLASCSQEEPGSEPGTQNGEIRFEIGFAPQTDPQTRVATDTEFVSTWENGDAIGIFAVEHGKGLAASGNYIHNVKLTYTGNSWTASEGIYWPKDGTKYDFYAYYPYSDAATDPTTIAFSVPVDQCEATTGKPAYNRNDLLMAKNDNNGAGFGRNDRAVILSFKHALAMVQVKVSSSMVGNYASDALSVWLNGCTTGCVLNLSVQTTTLSSSSTTTPQKIKMYPCPTDDSAPGIYAYRALVPVQTIAKGTAMFRFEYGDGNVLLRSKQLTTDLFLKAGQAETFDMTFPFTSATVSSGVRLANLFTTDELAKITHLKVLGEMTEADFTTIKEKMTGVTRLDLGGATVEGNAIPNEALLDMKSIEDFVFPQNIETIGDNAFFGCSGFTGDLTIPEGVKTIGNYAFRSCSGFTGSLTILKGVETIGAGAFFACRGFIGSLTIPEGVKTIGDNAFSYCSGFIGSLTIPEGVTSIGEFAFFHCSGFTGDLKIPKGVTIGNYAFSYCSGFTGDLTIPEGVETIGTGAFSYCSGFKGSLTIPEGVTSIDKYAFYGCSGFTGDLTIPKGVTTIGDIAFAECSNITSIYCYIENPNITYGSNIFNNVPDIPVRVPAAAVEAYKSHAVWEKFKDNIQAINP